MIHEMDKLFMLFFHDNLFSFSFLFFFHSTWNIFPTTVFTGKDIDLLYRSRMKLEDDLKDKGWWWWGDERWWNEWIRGNKLFPGNDQLMDSAEWD